MDCKSRLEVNSRRRKGVALIAIIVIEAFDEVAIYCDLDSSMLFVLGRAKRTVLKEILVALSAVVDPFGNDSRVV